MERNDRLVPEGSDPSQQPSSSRQNESSSRQSGSGPSPPFFGQELTTSEEYRSIIDQLELGSEETVTEEMFNSFLQFLDEDHLLSTALYRTLDKLQITESSYKHAFKDPPSTHDSYQRAEYYDPGPSTSQARFFVRRPAWLHSRQRPQEGTMFIHPGTSSEPTDNVERFCVPESARSFRQTHTSGPPIVKPISNVQTSSSVTNWSNLQHRVPLKTVNDPKKSKYLEWTEIEPTKISLQRPPSLPLVLQITPPSTQRPSQITSLPSNSRSLQTSPSTSSSKTNSSTSVLRFSSLPHLKVTTPPLNRLQMQLLLQTTIKMGVGYDNYTSNVNYKVCEPLMNSMLYEQRSNQSSPISNSSGSTPIFSSSSSLDQITEERPPNITDLGSKDVTAPDTIYRCGLRLAIKKTHLYSHKIQWCRIFFVPTELCPAVQTVAELALGFCVTYVGECDESWCKIHCHPQSYICSHMYSCSCPQKKKILGWCSHIHAATYCGLRSFYHDTVAFVPTTSGIMKIHHLRAKYKYMKLLKNWPAKVKAKLDDLELQGTIKQVRSTCICPKYKRCKECTACYCIYKCKCIDYRRLRFPCEHIHYLAMCIRKEASAVLANEFGHYNYQTDDSGDETDAEAPNVVEEHHQRSFCIKRRLIKQISKNSWTVKSNRTRLQYRVTSARNYDKKPGEQSECVQCRDRKAFNWLNCCETCSICPHDYKCTCDQNKAKKKYICKHIHAVARHFGRKRMRRSETDEMLAPARTDSSTESEDSDR